MLLVSYVFSTLELDTPS